MTSHDIPESIILSNRIAVLNKVSTGLQVEVIAQDNFDPNLDDPAECLRLARNRAGPIEAELFKNMPASAIRERRD
jgi:hypothetical protein